MTLESLGEYFDKLLSPFISKLVKNRTCFQHLEFSGSGSISSGQVKLASLLGRTYQGLFLKGFEAKKITDKAISLGPETKYFTECLNDPSLMQVAFLRVSDLDQALEDDDKYQDSCRFI